MTKSKAWIRLGAHIFVPWTISKRITGTKDKVIKRFGYVKQVNVGSKVGMDIKCHLFAVEGYDEETEWFDKNSLSQAKVKYNKGEIILFDGKDKYKIPFRPFTLKEGLEALSKATIAIHASGIKTVLYPILEGKDGTVYFFDHNFSNMFPAKLVMYNYVKENGEPFGMHI